MYTSEIGIKKGSFNYTNKLNYYLLGVSFLILTLFFPVNISAQMTKSNAEIFFEKANLYFDKNDFEHAIVYYDSTILANTEFLQAYAFRGICKFEMKRFQEAIEDFDLALILDGGYAEIYYYRGLAKKELGFNDKACSDWIEAYNLGLKKTLKLIEQNCEAELKKENQIKKTEKP